MKILDAKESGMLLCLESDEFDAFNRVLARYPVVPRDHHRVSRHDRNLATREAQELLNSARLEQEGINRGRIQRWLDSIAVPAPESDEVRLPIRAGDREWVLQILNDLRVGIWIQLGCPGPEDLQRYGADPAEVELRWTMDLCAWIQDALLNALT